MEEIERPNEPSMAQKVNEIYSVLKDSNKKQIKMPRKAKIKGMRNKKGWKGVIYIDENGTIRGEKEKLDDSVFREKRSIRYHATDGSETLFWEGKYPVILQPTWRKNPINIRKEFGEKNQTYGQKYIMARMLADVIKIKSKGAGLLWIIGLAIGGYLLYSMFTGGV